MRITDPEDCHIFIVRMVDQKEWMAVAERGDEEAKLCLWAVRKFMNAFPHAGCCCGCCDSRLSEHASPEAFVILVPKTEENSNAVRAAAMGVCAECSEHDDEWLVEQGPKRKPGRLAPTPPRSGDKIH
jgi:hypothetical protein